MTDHLQAALKLARAGTRVFPANPDKSPRIAGGFHNATTDEDTVRSWDWNSDSLVAACIPPGTVVIDVDPRNGGDATLQALADTYGALPPTRTVRTMSGGYHYYLTIPEGVTLRAVLGPGVDVKRAGKGYVIVPPSAGYSFDRGGEPAPAPEWLLDELVVDERSRPDTPASGSRFFAWEEGTAYGLAGMKRELERLEQTQEGGRNNALNRATFALAQLVAGGELDEEKTLHALGRVSKQIGLERDEARATVRSAWSKGLMEPRSAPEKERTTSPPLDTGPTEAEAEGRFWVDWEVDEPAPPFYLYPLVPRNAYVLVYGATEASKSMVWNGLLAQGSRRGIKCSVYSLENPPSTDRDRLRRLRPSKANFRLTNEPLDLSDTAQLEGLIRREKEWGTDLILIDTYSHAFNSRSEDGNAKAIDFARRVRWIMYHVGCTVVVVDHTGYTHSDEPRDASAKRQQVDVALLMEKLGEWQKGQPSCFAITNKKAARFANPCHYLGEVRDTADKGLDIVFRGGDQPTWRA